jgi:hypothetical protein
VSVGRALRPSAQFYDFCDGTQWNRTYTPFRPGVVLPNGVRDFTGCEGSSNMTTSFAAMAMRGTRVYGFRTITSVRRRSGSIESPDRAESFPCPRELAIEGTRVLPRSDDRVPLTGEYTRHSYVGARVYEVCGQPSD